MTFDGETLSPIGIQNKGSVGAFVNCLSGTDWANPSGFKTCTKLSMKLKTNWNDSDDKFYGLKKLKFQSQNLDNSQMHERLGYYLFREMDVAAPRSVHVKVYINGTYQGLFALTEQIDGRLIRENFEDGKGNLYKEVWPLNHLGVPQSQNQLLKGLKTNQDESPSIRMTRSFAQEIVNAQTTSEIKTALNKWMDMDETLAMAAVDRTIRHDDGPFHWYCTNGVCSNHNYYIYEEPTLEKIYVIPWDLDNAFENIAINSNPVTSVADPGVKHNPIANHLAFGDLV